VYSTDITEFEKKKILPQVAQLKLLLIVKNNNEFEWDHMKLTVILHAPAFLICL